MDREMTSLYLQNLLIMQENERMRRQARQLDQENKALLDQLKQRCYQQQQHQVATGTGTSTSTSTSGSAGGGGGAHSSAATDNLKTKAAGNKQANK